ncbi:MAG: TomO hydrophobic C-terminal domain-containing protein [Wolbachia sp.]
MCCWCKFNDTLLAICIALAVAVFASFAIGGYCSYKANTALSDVEVDQTRYSLEVYTHQIKRL